MDELSRQFINRYQGDFPVEELPYASVASILGTDSKNLLSLIQNLLDDEILDHFGPIYDISCISSSLSLCALSVPEDRYEEITRLLDELPEVTQYDQYQHELNMWFVIATETPEQLQNTISRIAQAANLPVYNFPEIQTFYLGLRLWLDENGRVTTQPLAGPLKQGGLIIDELDRCIVQASQACLALQIAPYTEIASVCGCDTKTVLHRMQRMLERGVIRRIGAVPNHYRLGLHETGMSVWDINDENLDELGAQIGRLDFVSHCHRRPRHLPLWPYNLFATVHGIDRTSVIAKVNQIDQFLGPFCHQHDVLFSNKILKKTN